MKVVMAFLHIIYEGYVLLSSKTVASDVIAVRELMASFGLHIPDSSWTLEGPWGNVLQVDQGKPQSELHTVFRISLSWAELATYNNAALQFQRPVAPAKLHQLLEILQTLNPKRS